MIAAVTLALLLAVLVGFWFLTGYLERITRPVIKDEQCDHPASEYSTTTGVTRCMVCGHVLDQEAWD